MEKKTTYYLLWNRVLGMRNENGDFLYKEGKWEKDPNMIQDRLVGYAPCEPEGSPYAFMNASIMDEIEEIPEERAMEILKEGN